MECPRGDDRPYPALMLAVRITLPHFSVSSTMSELRGRQGKRCVAKLGDPQRHLGIGKREIVCRQDEYDTGERARPGTHLICDLHVIISALICPHPDPLPAGVLAPRASRDPADRGQALPAA